MRDVVIESLVVIRYRVCTWSREVVIFQACIRETSLRHDAFFEPLLCKYVGCMIEFCRIFHIEKSILANLGYLIFKIFWGSMPSDPPPPPHTHTQDLGPMVKIESTSMRGQTPELEILIALLQILKTWLLWHLFQVICCSL